MDFPALNVKINPIVGNDTRKALDDPSELYHTICRGVQSSSVPRAALFRRDIIWEPYLRIAP